MVDELESPIGLLQLVAYEADGHLWVGVTRGSDAAASASAKRPPGLMSSMALRSGSRTPNVVGVVRPKGTWTLFWGIVGPNIVRAELRTEEGEAFPAKIVPLPSALEPEYRAAWGLVERNLEQCELVGYDAAGALFGESDPLQSRAEEPKDTDRLGGVREHADRSLREYAAAYLTEKDENRQLLQVYLDITANFLALVEADHLLDERGLLARRTKIVNRYIAEARLGQTSSGPEPQLDQPNDNDRDVGL